MSTKFLLLFITISFSLQAQSDSTFIRLIGATNELLEIYDNIHPLSSEVYALVGFDFSNEELENIKAEYELTADKDSIPTYELIFVFQEKILNNLEAIIQHPDFIENDISALLKGGAISVVKAPDDRLFSFSFDEKTGGTYRSRLTIIVYIDKKTAFKKMAFLGRGEEMNPAFDAFNPDGYSEIKTLETSEGTKYLMHSYVQNCSTCYREEVSLIKRKEGRFVEDFNYAIDFRDFEMSELVYDEESKQLKTVYLTSDLKPECACDDGRHETDDDFVLKKCDCVFEFDGLNFILKKSCDELIKE